MDAPADSLFVRLVVDEDAVSRVCEKLLQALDWRPASGTVQVNNKLRMIARRAFGFHSPEALIAMLFLCCGGIVLDAPLPPFRTH